MFLSQCQKSWRGDKYVCLHQLWASISGEVQLHSWLSVHHDLPQPTSLIRFLVMEKLNIIQNRNINNISFVFDHIIRHTHVHSLLKVSCWPTRVRRKASVPKARSSRNGFPHLLGQSWNTQKQFNCGFSKMLALLTSIKYTLSWGLQVPHTRWPLPHWKIFVGGPIGSKHTLKVKSSWSHVTFFDYHRTIWHQRRRRS